ncbi:replicative DNA helicase [Clostridium cylindrosporum]|uniref:Replicative DNA helicase n=1 Tax=Clostridium cylindrosporum DSM 605 TaxID=1121307 RepID=A0A0J8G209_CLOCY|nr:replicative DNA helicase [Clostridium cylindrosporum]KMT21796.1 replicative DNA helicase DnaC [Clostridium cylindrosporum DSM 605]
MEQRLRVPPYNIDAEQLVIGSMIVDKNAITAATEILKGEEFYKDSHKILFDAITHLYDHDTPVDIVTITEQLKTMDKTLDDVGGVSYISEIVSGVETTAEERVKAHARIVEDKFTLRRLIESSNSIMEKCYDQNLEVDSILSDAEKHIFNISQKTNTGDFEHLSGIIERSFEDFERMYNSKTDVTGIPSGFRDLDSKTSGFQKGDFVLIAARPSMGKTAFVLNLALHSGLRAGKSVAIFSLEMSREQLVYRMLCAEANIDMQKLRIGDLDDESWIRLGRASSPMSNSRIFIDDTPGITISELRSKCRRLKIEKGLDIIIIDYLQLMSGSRNSESRQQEVSEISRSLKAIAKEMGAPVIALSQLSRAPEMRADHRPILSDLRESGSIEQDADVVMFLYRDEYYNKETEKKGVAEVIIAKQRNGPTGTVELAWIGQYTRFRDLDKYHSS